MLILSSIVLMIPVYGMLIAAFEKKQFEWLLLIPFYIIFISFILYQLDKILGG